MFTQSNPLENNDLDLEILIHNQIVETNKIVNSYFSLQEKTNIIGVLQNLNAAESKLDLEIKADHKERGSEILRVLRRVGVFSHPYGPVQKMILEYSIPVKSALDDLVIPPRSNARI